MGDRYGIANTLNDMGVVADRSGEYAEARRLYEECLAIRRQIGHLWGIGTSLNNLGYLAYVQGEYAEAKVLLQESLAIQRQIGDQYHIANCLSNLGMTASALGEDQDARAYFLEALRFAFEIGAIPLVLEVLVGMAVLLTSGDPADQERAAELFVFVHHHAAGDQLTRERAARRLAGLASQLPPEVMAEAQERGETRELEMLVAEMLADA
jgi:tetratricopeptide (TPR) repeat protein